MKLIQDNAEVLTSMVTGAVINYALTVAIFGVSYSFAGWTTLVFFVASYTRSIIIRRIFRRIEK